MMALGAGRASVIVDFSWPSEFLWYPFFRGSNWSSYRAILACPHTLAWIWTLRTCCLKAPRVGGSLSLSAICLQKRYHRSSEMVMMLMPFGEQAAQTKLARLANIVWVTSASVCRELITSLYAFMYNCNQVALPMRENRPVLSAPVNAWDAGKAFALSGPMALHIGSIRITPEAIEIDVFLSVRSSFAITNIRTSVSGEKITI